VQVVAGSNPVAPTIEARRIAWETGGAAGFVSSPPRVRAPPAPLRAGAPPVPHSSPVNLDHLNALKRLPFFTGFRAVISPNTPVTCTSCKWWAVRVLTEGVGIARASRSGRLASNHRPLASFMSLPRHTGGRGGGPRGRAQRFRGRREDVTRSHADRGSGSARRNMTALQRAVLRRSRGPGRRAHRGDRRRAPSLSRVA